MAASPVSIVNNLDFNVTVYDSFSNQDDSNYFGILTSLSTVPANTTALVQLIHRTSVLIVSNATTNVPVARLIYMPLLTTGPLSVGPADVNAMSQTMDFINFITKNKDDPITVAFQAIFKDTSKLQVKPVNQFFAQHPPYASCTFATYMMGITYEAQLPETKGQPLDQALYSLSSLVDHLGGVWPSEFPNIVLTKFTCDTKNDILSIRGEIDLKKLPAQSDQALQFFGSLFSVQKIDVLVSFNYGFNLGVLGTRLSISLDAIHVPFGGSSSLTINKPTATIDINPLFKFVVFTVIGDIPFNIFGKQFEADVSMVIDNIEAEFGVVIKGDNTSLPGPPTMQGVHFDDFGVGIGIMFEPPGEAIGLSGHFHIGDPANNTIVALDDSSFAVVCEVVEEVPNPLYISFYVPQMHLTDVLTVFTNVSIPVDIPVSFTDLSFRWSENPMMPVALPDGTLSQMGYGFSAAANIFAFSFYGDVEIDLNTGVTADIEMGPLALGSVFAIEGDGTGVSIKVDATGSPIKNNQLLTKAVQQQALKDATMKQLVAPGGPVLKIRTLNQPFLHLNGSFSLFELEKVELTANITTSGIEFELDYSGLLNSTMSCTLSDFHNLAASFTFGINQTISLPSVAGISLGSIPLVTEADTHFSLSTGTSDIILSVGGNFDFEGLTRSFGDYTADAHIQVVSDLLSSIVSYIEENAEAIFSDIINTAEAWAGKVKQGVITAVDSVAVVLHDAFNQDADQIASTMKDAGYGVNEVTEGLKEVFDPSQVANTLKDVYGMSAQGVAQAMQQVGYAGDVVAGALKDAFGNDVAAVASALQSAYGWSTDQIHTALSQVGYTADQIGNAFQSLGGDFEKAGQSILDAGKSVIDHLNPTNCLVQ